MGDLLDLLAPRRCAGCGTESVSLCAHCLTELAVPVHGTVPRFGTVPVVAAGEYEGVLRELLVGFKERGRHDLAPVLGLLLARAVTGALLSLPGAPRPPVHLVPVPSTRGARRRRGSDHVLVLATEAARILRADGLPTHPAPVLAVRAHRDQVGFGSHGRRRNVAGTHRLDPRAGRRALAGLLTGTVVLVDDICTTGATLAESARVLRGYRIPTPGVATVGTTPGGPRFEPLEGVK